MATASSGGAAASGGIRLEQQVGAMLAVYGLASRRLPTDPLSPWPAEIPAQVGLQTGDLVDDVVVHTQTTGIIAIQVKKGLQLGKSTESPLWKALEQAVQMFRAGPPAGPQAEPVRVWNSSIDRIVIATDGDAPRSVQQDLVRVVARLARMVPQDRDERAATNQGERNALQVFRDHVERLWTQETGSLPAHEEFRSFCAMIRVASFALQPGGAHRETIRTILAGALVNQGQIDSAWTALIAACQDCASDRVALTAKHAREELGNHGIALKPAAEDPAETGPVYAPGQILNGPLASEKLREQVATAEAALAENDDTAADLFAEVITDLQHQRFPHVAAQLRPQLGRALRQRGRHAAADRVAVAAAWLPLWRGDVPAAAPEAMILELELGKSAQKPASRSGRAVLSVLGYEEGHTALSEVAEHVQALHVEDEHAAELLLWLAEEALACRRPELFAPLCDVAVAHAEDTGDREISARLRIAVAECRHDWDFLLATGAADYGDSLYALARARHGAALTRRNEFAEAITSYSEAIEVGTAHGMFAEVRTWLYDIRNLRAAFAGPGRGTETHFIAQSLPTDHRISVFEGEQQLLARALECMASDEHGRAYRILMRLRRRMAAGAAVTDQRVCERHLAATVKGLDNPDLALQYYLRSGAHKPAITLVRDRPDAPLVPDEEWFTGPVWQTHAAFELLATHADLVPAGHARALFDELASRLVTQGPITGWSNFQANITSVKTLAALAWASSESAATHLLDKLAPLAKSGGFPQAREEYVQLVLTCAHSHPGLAPAAAQQLAQLWVTHEDAVPARPAAVVRALAPARNHLAAAIRDAFTTDTTWLLPLLVALGEDSSSVVNHVNERLIRASQPRVYRDGTVSVGTTVVRTARMAHLGSVEHRKQFVTAMLAVATERREAFRNRREAIDAVTILLQHDDGQLIDQPMASAIRTAMHSAVTALERPGETSTHHLVLGEPADVDLAAHRLLLMVTDDAEECARLAQLVLLHLIDDPIPAPRQLATVLTALPADILESHLLALATSRTAPIRTVAARCWAELPSAEARVGHQLATDTDGTVRARLAASCRRNPDRPGADAILVALRDDCRYSVRTAATGEVTA